MTVATSSKSHLPRRYRPRLIRSGRLERALQWAPGFYGAQEPGIVGIAFKSKPALILACDLPATRHGRSAIRRRASGRRGPWSARPYRHIASFGENGGPGLSAPSMTASFAGQDSPFILPRLGKQLTARLWVRAPRLYSEHLSSIVIPSGTTGFDRTLRGNLGRTIAFVATHVKGMLSMVERPCITPNNPC